MSGPLAVSTPFPRGRAARPLWLLEEGTIHLNHGAFGATPRAVLSAQDRVRVRAERQPPRFFVVEAVPAIRRAAGALAGLLGTEAEHVALVENATSGVGSILTSMPWSPGDEVVTTSHTYPAVRNALRHLARGRGVVPRVAEVPFPLSGPHEVLEAIAGSIGPRTRLVVCDHVTSQTAVVFPIEAVAALCRDRGTPLLVDGAHAPGMLELNLPAVGADWYVGNCHKWLCAAKGTAFVWRNPDSRFADRALHPATISHHLDEAFPAEHDWIGTRDVSSWHSLPAALAFHDRLGGAKLRADNIDLARRATALLADAWGCAAPVPEAMTGSLGILPHPVPDRDPGQDAVHAEMARIRDTFGIEVAVTGFAGRRWVRFSAQAYNEPSDYLALGRALRKDS